MGVFDELDREVADSAAAARKAAVGRRNPLTPDQQQAFDQCQASINEFLRRMKAKNYPHESILRPSRRGKSGYATKTIHGRGRRLTLWGWEPAAHWGGRWSEQVRVELDGRWSVADAYGRSQDGYYFSGEAFPQVDDLTRRLHGLLTEYGA